MKNTKLFFLLAASIMIFSGCVPQSALDNNSPSDEIDVAEETVSPQPEISTTETEDISREVTLENTNLIVDIPNDWKDPVFEDLGVDENNMKCYSYTIENKTQNAYISILPVCKNIMDVYYEMTGSLSDEALEVFSESLISKGYNIWADFEKDSEDEWYYIFHKGKDVKDGYQVLVGEYKFMVTVHVKEGTMTGDMIQGTLLGSAIVFESLINN